MELKVNAVAIPDPITFNYEELKAELMRKAEAYASLVYTEDQIKIAKADRANLNRLKKALNDERLKQEREYMQPFNQFKAQIQEIISIIDKPCAVIDQQVKAFEEQQKQDKLEKIQAYFYNHAAIEGFEVLRLDQVFDDKWLNASVSMKSIQEAIGAKFEQIDKDLAVIRSLPFFAFEAEEAYMNTLDLGRAVSEAHRLQDLAAKKAAYEAEQAKRREAFEEADAQRKEDIAEAKAEGLSGTIEPVRQWVGFQALLSVEEAKALGQYMKDNGIRYKKG